MPWSVVCIGVSWGGMTALEQILPALPAGFGLPVIIAQHRSGDVDTGLAEHLQRFCARPVREAEDKLALGSVGVVLAPPGYHVLVNERCLELSDETPVCRARPSIDVLFESAADAFGARAVGLLLTGNSADGAEGMKRLKAVGALTAVQDPASAEAPRMPKEALARMTPDAVLGLHGIGPWMAALGRRPQTARR
ncbi:MAG: chemotaxis protein CheB [Myxococcales bacterium]